VVVVPLLDTANASGVGTVLEAMAMAKPLVVSASAGIRDFIVPGETCLVVPVGDDAALRDAVKRRIENPGLGVAKGKCWRGHVIPRFENLRFAEGLAQTIHGILEKTVVLA